MMNRENRNILLAYTVTVVLVALLIVVIMKADSWIFKSTAPSTPEFTTTPPVSENDLRFGLFNDAQFRSLGPLLTDAERKQLEAIENPPKPVEPGENGVVTGTVKPSTGAKRELRRSNPFLPF